jgi:hypothetical protein
MGFMGSSCALTRERRRRALGDSDVEIANGGLALRHASWIEHEREVRPRADLVCFIDGRIEAFQRAGTTMAEPLDVRSEAGRCEPDDRDRAHSLGLAADVWIAPDSRVATTASPRADTPSSSLPLKGRQLAASLRLRRRFPRPRSLKYHRSRVGTVPRRRPNINMCTKPGAASRRPRGLWAQTGVSNRRRRSGTAVRVQPHSVSKLVHEAISRAKLEDLRNCCPVGREFFRYVTPYVERPVLPSPRKGEALSNGSSNTRSLNTVIERSGGVMPRGVTG